MWSREGTEHVLKRTRDLVFWGWVVWNSVYPHDDRTGLFRFLVGVTYVVVV